ncbi:MAG: tetratricopeptide repeat protein, partial [Actinomycetota bacterium]|nr:tetratricopeptide repeat protein [Actinomycetota bacterium]
VWDALGQFANVGGPWEQQTEAAEQAFHHARLAGREEAAPRSGLSLVFGPRPADAALAALPDNPPPWYLLVLAVLLAMLGRFDEAWEVGQPAAKRYSEMTGELGPGELVLADVARYAGDHAAAARLLRRGCERLEAAGNIAELSTYAPILGRELCALGRHEEAEPLARRGRELGDEHDVMTQVLWRQVQALVHASRAEHDEADRLARDAVAVAERTDGLNLQGDALCDLAEVLAAAGRIDEAAAALEQALERYERKKNLATAAQVRPKLEALREEARA